MTGPPTARTRLRNCIATHAQRAFSLDVRSLAALRVALGALLLVDLGIRAVDFSVMYVDGGIAPVAFARAQLAPGEWSLHLWSGAPAFQATLFVTAAASAIALILGFHSRCATIVSWALLASLHNRLPIVLNAGDTLLRLLLFWSMFLPLGSVWGLDARRRGPPSANCVASVATLAYVVQLSLMYWCAGLAKWNATWLDGDALGNVFSFGLYSQPAGRWLLQHSELTRWLSRAVVVVELVGPCLLYVPWQTARLRTIAAILFAAFHLGIAATVTVGLFPWVGVAAWLALIPGEAWDWAGLRTNFNGSLRTVTKRPVSALAPRRALARLQVALVVAALGLVVYVNAVDRLRRVPSPALHAWLRPLANASMLRQAWPLFGVPTQYDAWFIYLGRLKDGRRVDLRTGNSVDDDRLPSPACQSFSNHRWRKLHTRLPQDRYAAHRQPLAEYFCRHWNETHAPTEQAVRLDFYCIRRPVARDKSSGFVRQNLAQVLVDPTEGNFADALREMEF